MLWPRTLALLLVFCLCCPARGFAVELTPQIEGMALGTWQDVLRDDSRRLDLAAVQHNNTWRPLGEPVGNFGLSTATYWFRLPLKVLSPQPPWLLEVSYPLLDNVELHVVANDREQASLQAGLRHDITGRLAHRNFLFRLGALEAGDYTLYLRVQSAHAVQVPTALWRVQRYLWLDETRNIVVGMLAGAMLVMLLYNLLLFSVAREQVYLLYFGVVISVLLLQFGMQGIGVRHFWPRFPAFAEHSLVFGGLTSTFFCARFTVAFLDLEARRHLLHRPYSWLGYASLAAALASLWLPPAYTVPVMVVCALIGGVFASGILMSLFGERSRPIVIFAFGWGVLIAGVLVLGLNKLGLIPMNFFTEQLISFGILIQLALFSMALGDRINYDKQQTLEAQTVTLATLERERSANALAMHNEEQARLAREKTLSLQTQNNLRLEQEIERRTAELTQATAQLREISRIDPLTGIFNRREFNERLNAEYARAVRHRALLSLILFDIDFFKSINDRYGHVVGDNCIVHIAQLLRDQARDHAGMLSRFGGEEFALLLPGYTLHQAMELAETLRIVVAASTLEVHGVALRLTVSGGVAEIQPRADQPARLLIEQADAALYEAKAQGRNRVIVSQGVQADA